MINPPTPKETARALEASIVKWESRADGNFAPALISACPLCDLFYGRGNACGGCPVAERTGDPDCMSAPFSEYHRRGNTPRGDIAIAERGVDFLKSLRVKRVVAPEREETDAFAGSVIGSEFT